jgi:hypothetical protein
MASPLSNRHATLGGSQPDPRNAGKIAAIERCYGPRRVNPGSHL